MHTKLQARCQQPVALTHLATSIMKAQQGAKLNRTCQQLPSVCTFVAQRQPDAVLCCCCSIHTQGWHRRAAGILSCYTMMVPEKELIELDTQTAHTLSLACRSRCLLAAGCLCAPSSSEESRVWRDLRLLRRTAGSSAMTGELVSTLALLLLRRRLLPGSSGLSAAWQHSCWKQLGG